jgi:hypothetical protein
VPISPWRRMVQLGRDSSVNTGKSCRLYKGLSVIMSPEVSSIGGDQSVDELRHGLAEAREQQAATEEILAAISSSHGTLPLI